MRHQRNLHGPGCTQGLPHHNQQGHQGDTDGPISMTVLNPLNSNTHHAGPSQASSNSPLLHCTYEGCSKTYSRREHLNRHLKLHMGIEPERPYYCLDCGKTFTRKEHLLRHRRGHTGETPYHCPGRQTALFNSRSDLTSYLRSGLHQTIREEGASQATYESSYWRTPIPVFGVWKVRIGQN